VDLSRAILLAVAVLAGLAAGPWLAGCAARLAARDPAARPGGVRTAVTAVLTAALLAGAAAVGGWRPATVALAWAAGSAVVLASVDLASHRLPDRVVYPAVSVCTAALAADGALLGSWPALLRAALAAAAAVAVAGLGWLVSPAGIGLGDVKLLGLLGLVLGWLGWGVLLAGVFLGLVAGALTSVVLVAARRAGWRTALPFGPPLLLGAVLSVAVSGPLPGAF
jgi:leader peptidase (prepilin peptidase)/N-methyltransferase